MGSRMIKCPKCGVFNTDRDYCKNCNTLISNDKKRELKVAAEKQKRINEAIYTSENPGFAERLKKHPNLLYSFVGWVLYSVISVVSIIGAGLAWLIAMVAAG
jgi:uncharacterized C2H2 Zn-finger protein